MTEAARKRCVNCGTSYVKDGSAFHRELEGDADRPRCLQQTRMQDLQSPPLLDMRRGTALPRPSRLTRAQQMTQDSEAELARDSLLTLSRGAL